ncbi:hypothetical protein EWM64_g9402 [Hericium alpestre]|uniref:Clathrin light chain n=1 Tax=Hericium alpestre TaxID=135208 RepID=A0A4Y9ZMF6_9AGAM|nr:hypothetical protein EWM64_g9402 [Hericium alpestre]
MDRQRSPLPTDGEDLLQAALSDAFSVGDLPRQPAVVAVQETQSATLTAVEAPATTSSEEEGMSSSAVSAQDYDAWKAEYDAQLVGWRQESAKAREHAEAERARWEEIRQREKREGGAVSEAWESVADSAVEELGATLARAQGKSAPQTEVGSDSPSPADVRDLVEGEKPGAHTQEYIEAALPRAGPSIVIDTAGTPSQAADATPAGHADTTSPTHAHDPSHASSSPRWEDVTSSLTSSFPSMSFPETSRPESPEHQHHPPAPSPPP